MTGSENTIKGIQAERIMYQINSSAETKKIVEKMRRDMEVVTKAMQNAQRVTYEKRLDAEELKIRAAEKREEVIKIRNETERAKVRVSVAAKKTVDLENETNRVKDALDRIRDAVQSIDGKYTEKAQSDLANVLIKLKHDTEKAQSDFNAAKEMEALTTSKLQNAEMNFNNAEAQTIDITKEADRLESNVANAIEHIIKSYNEIAEVSKDILKSSTVVIDTEHFEHIVGQNEPEQETNSEIVIQ